jgi:hypothetical protein
MKHTNTVWVKRGFLMLRKAVHTAIAILRDYNYHKAEHFKEQETDAECIDRPS